MVVQGEGVGNGAAHADGLHLRRDLEDARCRHVERWQRQAVPAGGQPVGDIRSLVDLSGLPRLHLGQFAREGQGVDRCVPFKLRLPLIVRWRAGWGCREGVGQHRNVVKPYRVGDLHPIGGGRRSLRRLRAIGVVQFPAIGLGQRHAPVVVDVGDVVVVLIPHRPGVDPVPHVTDDEDALATGNHDIGNAIAIHITHRGVLHDRA